MKRKFTLIELIIVIVVIGLLAAMALPKVTGVVQNAKLSAMINDKEVLEKAIILYYQKYGEYPLLNEDQELIISSNGISLLKMVQAEEVNDMTTIYTSLQETLKHYDDEEEYLYRVDMSKVSESLSKKLKYGNKKKDKDFYVYSTKTNNVYYYGVMLNGDNEIQHDEFNTSLKESELVNKKKSYDLKEEGFTINNKPNIELTTNLNNVKSDTLINWTYNFIDEDTIPIKISFILNDVEYDSFDKIPTQLDGGEYIIKLKMQDSKGLWSNELIKEFKVTKIIEINSENLKIGPSFGIKLDDNGNLYSWGSNNYGQLGVGDFNNKSIPTLIKMPNNIKVKKFFIKNFNCMAIGEDDNLYSWGYNTFGQLGIGNNINQNTPQLVVFPNEEKPINVFFSGYHSMIITEKGNLYAFGKNSDGQLGLGHKEDKTTPQKVNLKAKQIHLSSLFSLAIGEDGYLYTWGSNTLAQCGTKNSNTTIPNKISLPNGKKPNAISSEDSYSIILTEDNLLYSFGYNAFGQLGVGNNINQFYPTLVSSLKFKDVSTNSNHSLAITENGIVYSWGRGEEGQLGSAGTSTQFTPFKVKLPNDFKAKSIYAKSKYSIVLGENGDVYSFGYNDRGQLGIGDVKKQVTPTKVIIPHNERIKEIITGFDSAFCISESNNVYVFGWNELGQLNLENYDNQYTPVKANFLNN